MLNAQFAHTAMSRLLDPRTVRMVECDSTFLELSNAEINRVLLVFSEVPPRLELLGVFDLPSHGSSIGYSEYSVKRIFNRDAVPDVFGAKPCGAVPSMGRIFPVSAAPRAWW